MLFARFDKVNSISLFLEHNQRNVHNEFGTRFSRTLDLASLNRKLDGDTIQCFKAYF